MYLRLLSRNQIWKSYCKYRDHIDFNSERQLRKYGQRCREAGISVGLRINPQCSTQGDHALYDPCAPGSRFGVTSDKIPSDLLELVDGLSFFIPSVSKGQMIYKRL